MKKIFIISIFLFLFCFGKTLFVKADTQTNLFVNTTTNVLFTGDEFR